MADVNSAPQNGPVLSYNVANDRGWNDPPSFVFSPNSTGNRKRIDPRKRVPHNISSMSNGYGSPAPSQSFQPIQPTHQPGMMDATTPYTNMYAPPINGLSNGMHNMSLAPSTGSLHHSNSNPDLHQMTQTNNMPPPSMHYSASVPAHMNQAGQNRIPGHAFGTMTPPPSGCNTPPPMHQRSGSATPPHAYIHNNTTSTRKMSAPSVPFANPSIFSQHSTPTMLQSSHLKPNEHSPVSTPLTNRSPITVQPTSLPHRISPMPPPSAVPEHLNNGVYNRSQSTPEAYGRPSPSPTNIPPPTTGYYAQKPPSGKNSPNSQSPIASGRSSPASGRRDSSLVENDSDALSNTMNFLNNFKNKCLCSLTNKQADDIAKKLQVFETSWKSGKLSQNAKLKMVQLAQALNGNDLQQADQVHKSLVREHSNEVSSWIIAIKKMLTTFQSQ